MNCQWISRYITPFKGFVISNVVKNSLAKTKRLTSFPIFAIVLAIGFFAITNPLFAEEDPVVEKAKFSPVEAQHATWVFSGIVSSESGEDFGYFFQLQRENEHFHASVALINSSNKQVIFREESDAELTENTPYDWRVGHAFLRFNPINDSWIFGVKNQSKQGFNFKVDMLKQFAAKPSFHHLRSGLTMMISQTSDLNGHISMGEDHPEQFVSAKDAWFRQIWQEKADTDHVHRLTSVLCRFQDGSSFYSVNLPELDAESGAVAGWFNPLGERKAMSQFIQVSQSKEGAWRIKSPSPHLDMKLADASQQHNIAAGFIDNDKKPGFCMVNKELG